VGGSVDYTNPVRDVSFGHGPVRKHVRAILRGIAGKVVCLLTLVALVVRACYDVMAFSAVTGTVACTTNCRNYDHIRVPPLDA
jgi:hypothetical protein